MVSAADGPIKEIDGVFRGREQGQSATGISPSTASSPVKGGDSHHSVSQVRAFFAASLRLSLVTRSISTSARRLVSPKWDEGCWLV
jgi:hypothetical protein